VFAYGGLPKQLMQQLKERITELSRDRRFRMPPEGFSCEELEATRRFTARR